MYFCSHSMNSTSRITPSCFLLPYVANDALATLHLCDFFCFAICVKYIPYIKYIINTHSVCTYIHFEHN
jgi:hypothetical protein